MLSKPTASSIVAQSTLSVSRYCSSDTNFACWSPPLWDFPGPIPKDINRQVSVSVVVSSTDGSQQYTVTKSGWYWYDQDRTP